LRYKRKSNASALQTRTSKGRYKRKSNASALQTRTSKGFLTLGNFHHNNATDTVLVNPSPQSQNDDFAYYYIDNVSLVEDSSTGINELENAGFELFPNPTQNTIQVLFQEDVSEISIVDLCGKELIHVKPIGSSLSIDCASLANGIYIVQCKFREGNLLYKKIIMQH
jgi:hypothetical protein